MFNNHGSSVTTGTSSSQEDHGVRLRTSERCAMPMFAARIPTSACLSTNNPGSRVAIVSCPASRDSDDVGSTSVGLLCSLHTLMSLRGELELPATWSAGSRTPRCPYA